MTVALRPAGRRPLRLVRMLADLAVGGVLCTTPVTSVLALGWISRAMAAVQTAQGRPGWLLGPPGQGAVVRLLGGFGANIAAGLRMAMGLAIWTLPFGLLWLGAWWAGWENSFNKGYEQATVGPVVFLCGTLLSLPVLALLPWVVVHAATQGTLAAFFDLRRILHLARAARWRGLWLAVLSLVAALPLLGHAALPVFIEELRPGFASLSAADQAAIAGQVRIGGAIWAFAALWFLRLRAARIAARAAPPVRWSGLWLVPTALMWSGLMVLIVVGQFMQYAPARWITHPLYLLPWPG